MKKNQKGTEVKINDWVVVTDKNGLKVIIYAVKSRGEVITGVAKCNPADGYDEERGRQLAYKRCQLKQRTRDLAVCGSYIYAIETALDVVEENEGIASRNFQRALQLGYREYYIQECNVHRLKLEIEALCNGMDPKEVTEYVKKRMEKSKKKYEKHSKNGKGAE
jgi:hypothetical protein